jgi:peroxiredoxin
MIDTGNPAPEFRAPSSNGQTLDTQSFMGKVPVVLTFLGGLDDPALAGLDGHLADFGRERVQVLGVVKVSPKELRAHVDEKGLNLTLLSDEGGSMAESFGLPPAHTSIIIDTDGIVRGIESGGDADAYATNLLGAVRDVKRATPSMAPGDGA